MLGIVYLLHLFFTTSLGRHHYLYVTDGKLSQLPPSGLGRYSIPVSDIDYVEKH